MKIQSTLDITKRQKQLLWAIISVTILLVAIGGAALRPSQSKKTDDAWHHRAPPPFTLHFKHDDMATWAPPQSEEKIQALIKTHHHVQDTIKKQQHMLAQLEKKTETQQIQWETWQQQVEHMLTTLQTRGSMKKHEKKERKINRQQRLVDSRPVLPSHPTDIHTNTALMEAQGEANTPNTDPDDPDDDAVEDDKKTRIDTLPIIHTASHKKKSKKGPHTWQGWLPAGGFFHGTLLTGIEAGTGSHTQMNPQPVLIRVEGDAILPNAARYALRACFVLGSAYGSASSERAYIRTTRISCVSGRYHAVLAATLQGFVVDSDGKLGLRGRLINRQGTKLAKAMFAGFFSGLANMTTEATHMADNALKKTSTMLPVGRAVRAVGLSGADNVAKELMHFYLNEAKRLFPVIEVGAGRHVLINVSRGVSLVWKPIK